MAVERRWGVTSLGLIIVGVAGLASGLMLAYAAQAGDASPPGVTGTTRGPLVAGPLPVPSLRAPVEPARPADDAQPPARVATSPPIEAAAPPAKVAVKPTEAAAPPPSAAEPPVAAPPPSAAAPPPSAAAPPPSAAEPPPPAAPVAAAPAAPAPVAAPAPAAPSPVRQVELGKQYLIVWASTRVRSAPAPRARVVSALLRGARVKVLARQGPWLKVSGRRLPDDAWILDAVLFPKEGEPAAP